MKRVVICILAVLVAATFIISASAAGKKLVFAVIAHETSSSFTAEFKQGAEDAGKQLGVDVKFMGPTQIDIPKQVAMLESAVEAKYDGIATVIMDPNAYKKAFNKAKLAGIPIVTFNQEASPQQGEAYVGSDMESQGYAIGKYMFGEVMKGKGTYLIASAIPALPVLVQRMAGMKKAQSEYPDIKLIDVVEIGTDFAKAFGAVENAYTAHPDVNMIMGTDHFSVSIGDFIKAKKLNGKVFAGCFDLLPGTLKNIKEGAVQATCGQNPYLQGYFPVILLYNKIVKQINPININSGAEMIDAKNIDAYLKKYNVK